MFIRLEFHHLVGHFFVVGVAQQMRGGAAKTVRNLIYRGFVCSYRIESDSVNFNKATRGGEVNADTRSCFVSAKLLKLTVNCWCDRLCGVEQFRVLSGGDFYFRRKSPGECFSSRPFKQRPTKFLPAVVLLGGRRGGAKSVKFESLVLELEVGGLPAAVEEKWAKDASVVRLQKVEFLNYSRFITAVTRWIPSEGGVCGITPQIRWKFK